MTNELQTILADLGFTDGESKIYIALLHIGETKVGPLIKSSGISRSKVYDILERLIAKQVVSKIEKNGLLFYQPLPPNSLFNIIKTKEKKIHQQQTALQTILPKLSQLHPKQDFNIMIYQGYDGFKTMIDKTINELNSNDTYEAMGISHTTESMRHYARKIYIAQQTKRFKARSIFDRQGIHKAQERKTPWHKIKVLPLNWHTPALFTIYNNTVGIHIGKDQSIISIVIKNEEIARSFRASFAAMWEISKFL